MVLNTTPKQWSLDLFMSGLIFKRIFSFSLLGQQLDILTDVAACHRIQVVNQKIDIG